MCAGESEKTMLQGFHNTDSGQDNVNMNIFRKRDADNIQVAADQERKASGTAPKTGTDIDSSMSLCLAPTSSKPLNHPTAPLTVGLTAIHIT
jgi:hypothetical protein